MTRHALFTLDDGDVSVSFPDKVSDAEVDQIEAYFTLLLKGIRRRAQNAQVASDEPEESVAALSPAGEK